MIIYKRPNPPEKYLASRKIAAQKKLIREKVAKDSLSLKPEDFVDLWSAYKEPLVLAQGKGKCGYCESRILATSGGTIDHFRPKAEIRNAIDQGERHSSPTPIDRKRNFGPIEKPGYWWLAYEWSNWIFSCTSCNSSWKKNQFPQGKNEFTSEVEYEKLSSEVLNPFDTINPLKHISFKLDGDIVATTSKGEETINVLGLDRWALVDERARLIETLLSLAEDYKAATQSANETLIKRTFARAARMCDPDAAYSGMIRSLIDANKFFGEFNAWELTYMRDGGALSE